MKGTLQWSSRLLARASFYRSDFLHFPHFAFTAKRMGDVNSFTLLRSIVFMPRPVLVGVISFFSNFLCIGIKRRSPLKTPATRPTFLPSTADVLRATTITHRPASNRTAAKTYFLPLNSGRRTPGLQAITAVSQTAISSNSSHCRMHSINGCS